MDRSVLEAVWTEHLRNNPHDHLPLRGATISDADLLALVRGKYPDLFDGRRQSSSREGEPLDERDRPPRPLSPPRSLLFDGRGVPEGKRGITPRRTIRDLDPPVVYRQPRVKKIPVPSSLPPVNQRDDPPSPPVVQPVTPSNDLKEVLPSWLQDPEIRSLLELIRDGRHEAGYRGLDQLPFSRQQWLRHYRSDGDTPLQRYLRDKDPAAQELAMKLLSS